MYVMKFSACVVSAQSMNTNFKNSGKTSTTAAKLCIYACVLQQQYRQVQKLGHEVYLVNLFLIQFLSNAVFRLE